MRDVFKNVEKGEVFRMYGDVYAIPYRKTGKETAEPAQPDLVPYHSRTWLTADCRVIRDQQKEPEKPMVYAQLDLTLKETHVVREALSEYLQTYVDRVGQNDHTVVVAELLDRVEGEIQ